MQYYGTDPCGPTVVAISLGFGVMTFVVIALRLFARVYLVKAVGADDILIVIACLLSWAFIFTSILATQHGLGSHLDSIPEIELTSYSQIVWLSSIFYNACLGFIKTSVLALYIRIGDRGLQKPAIVMLAVVACQASANVLLCIFQCQPIQRAWDLNVIGQCVDINEFYVSSAALNILTDCLTYVLPVGLVRHLQLPLREKIGIGIMLCLGFFACISSIVRITFVPALLASTDPTYVISDAMYWSAIETNVGILAASIPSFKPIAKRCLSRIIGEGTSKRQKDSKVSSFKRSQHSSSSTRSGFVELPNGHRGYHGHDDFTMDSLYGRPIGIDTKCKFSKLGHGAHVASSDEIILPPAGKILAKTRISIRSDS